jgi:hypothetical protein
VEGAHQAGTDDAATTEGRACRFGRM